ncbi:hypothetical protein [Mesorhizobium sp. B2-3-5]|uniref:hypothetical protein n=1 Tax=Mesorhizobium sp. B2-3-5 TaxID=2589958 RepID=UPI001AED2AD5|nr:hypothetical protein [Mesorhizobium sp. B2-3-5]
MGAALSLNGMGVNLSRAFKMVEDRHAHQLFASIVVGEKWPDRALFAVFDPERQGEFRQSVIARFDTSPAAMFSSPVDHDIPSEGYLIVNLSAIGRRRLKDIENFVSAGGDK